MTKEPRPPAINPNQAPPSPDKNEEHPVRQVLIGIGIVCLLLLGLALMRFWLNRG